MTGAIGLVLALVAVFAATFFAVAVAFGMRDRSLRESRMAQIMTAGTARRATPDEGEKGSRFLPAALVRLGDRLAGGLNDPSGPGGLRAKLDPLLERAAWTLTPGEFIATSLLVGTGAWFLGMLIVTAPIFAFFLAAVAAATPTAVACLVGIRRVAKMQGQFPDVLQVIASSLRAGHSFLQALEAAAKEVPEPSASEFSRVNSEIRLGRETQDALEDMAERVRSEDFRWAVLAISIQREVGGNLAEVLDTVARTIREREGVRRQVQVLSAEGRLSMVVLCGLPFGLGGYMAMVNPEYLGLLFSTNLGIVMLVVAGCLMTAGMFWMRKVVRIDV